MNVPARFLIAAFSCALLAAGTAGPASGQYMFLDVDGDGENFPYHEWARSDTVRADLYIVTDKNRDGSDATCAADGASIELRGFSVVLEDFFAPFEVVGIEPRIPGMAQTFTPVATPYGLSIGYSTPPLPPGKHKVLRVITRAWSLRIVPSSCIAPPGVTTYLVTNCGEIAADEEGTGYGYATDQPNRRSITTAPSTVAGRVGEPISFDVNVFDPECGDSFSFLVSGMPAGASFSGLGPFGYRGASGTFSWTPAAGQAGEYEVIFATKDPDRFNMTDNDQADTTHVTVATEPLSANLAPEARAGGPYSAIVGAPVTFHAGASSDPEGDALSFAWDFGDGQNGVGPDPSHVYSIRGIYPVVLSATDAAGAVGQDRTTATIEPPGLSLIRSIAPNPARASSVLEFVTTRSGAASIRLFDVNGRFLAQTALSLEAGLHRFPIPRATATGVTASGIYFVQVNTEFDGMETRRIAFLR